MREQHSTPFIFVSYSHQDIAFVSRLRVDFEQNGIASWLDEGLQPGTPDWEEALREQIRMAHAMILIASPNARKSFFVKDEIRLAAMYRKPVYPLWVAGEEWIDSIPLGLGGMQYIDIRDIDKYEKALPRIVAVLRETPFIINRPSPEMQAPTEPLVEPRNPYKGLLAFTDKDITDFFGREDLIDDLVNTLEALLHAEKEHTQFVKLLAVIGGSGSGKSSVLMAGLLPYLQKGGLTGSQNWLYLKPIVPGQRPIEALAITLAEKMPEKSLKSILDDLNDASARGLHTLVITHLIQKDCREAKVVLFIDQFEELFQSAITEVERKHFINLLITAATEHQGPVIILLTLRADFYDRPILYPEFASVLQKQHRLVLSMDLQSLRTIIEKPANLPDVQVTFEENLVGDLLFEVQQQVGALPLLEFTLDQLFRHRQGRLLTRRAYLEIGGVRGALLKRAEDVYSNLPSEKHRELARVLFLRLIDPGITAQDTTRRRAPLSELRLTDPTDDLLMQETINAFISARLLTTNQGPGTTTLEVSHEALIREWPRLREWLIKARDDIQFQQIVSRDVIEWERRGHPRDHLYQGTQLKEAKAWATRYKPSRSELTFLTASESLRRRSSLSIVGIALLLLLLLYPTFELLLPLFHASVYNLNDAGPGSLRYAVENAADGATITFDNGLTGSINLINDDIRINKNLTIHAPDNGGLSLSGYYGIQVSNGVTVKIDHLNFRNVTLKSDAIIYNNGTTELSNCTFSNNNIPYDINNPIKKSLLFNNKSSMMTLNNSTITNNVTTLPKAHAGGPLIKTASTSGGGPQVFMIYNSGGTLTINQSILSYNKVDDNDFIDNYLGNLAIKRSKITRNTFTNRDFEVIYNSGTLLSLASTEISYNDAAGITNNESKTQIVSSTISNNLGTGIFSYGYASELGMMTIANSTISNNHAGGISLSFNKATLTNSTVTGNGLLGDGGGIDVVAAQVFITFCTIYNNNTEYDKSTKPITGGRGGGISVTDHVNDQTHKKTVAMVTMSNSIVGDDSAQAKVGTDIFGQIDSGGYNLIQNIDGLTIHDIGNARDILGTKFQLNALDNNGGDTETLSLPTGSPAIGQIPFDVCRLTHITTDQRGVSRMRGKGCDTGAYQS